jgi:hypothetical protein
MMIMVFRWAKTVLDHSKVWIVWLNHIASVCMCIFPCSCCYGLMNGDLKLRGSKAPCRTVAAEKVRKKTACLTYDKSGLETLNQQLQHV